MTTRDNGRPTLPTNNKELIRRPQFYAVSAELGHPIRRLIDSSKRASRVTRPVAKNRTKLTKSNDNLFEEIANSQYGTLVSLNFQSNEK